MKIYKLTTNQVEDLSSRMAIISSYKAERTPIKEEFYLSKEKAEAVAKEKTEAIHKLAGFFPNVEFRVSEVEVIE